MRLNSVFFYLHINAAMRRKRTLTIHEEEQPKMVSRFITDVN